jgi:hypothetical protein
MEHACLSNNMQLSQFGLPIEEFVYQQMREFHFNRLDLIANGNAPLDNREGGVIVVHLIPESSVLEHRSIDANILATRGSRIRPLGDGGGNTRFNVDGFLNRSGYRGVRAYSQLFRNGRVEAVMSGVGYRVRPEAEKSPYVIRCSLTERAVLEVVHDYLELCEEIHFEPPIWLFSALVECKGFRMMTDKAFQDLSKEEVDRSPAVLPEFRITNLRSGVQELLHQWCDTLWQASGLQRSLNFDHDGNWHERH